MAMMRNAVSTLFVAFVLMTVVKATTYTVGDDDFWESGVDYKAWASGKSFKVGDVLVFIYHKQYHDVRRVSEQDYNSCNIMSPIELKRGGNSTVVLTEFGKTYFLCGGLTHCIQGMKFVVDTSGAPYSDNSPPPPAPRARPPPPPAATKSWKEQASNSANRLSLAASFALALVLMMLAAI